jgi:thymidylate synthase (FAD)
MPIFVARQWIRHRTARVNEISGRYTVLKDEFYLPDLERIQYQSKNNKQGSSNEEVSLDVKNAVQSKMLKDQGSAAESYHNILDNNIAKELARINLPLSTYTEWYWSMDAHNLFHFLKLRLDKHAQWEIQQYGLAIAEIVKKVIPMAWDAFEKHTLKSVKFSASELEVIDNHLRGIDYNSSEFGLSGQAKTDFLQKLGWIK